jgi:lipoprotein Spr
MHIGIVLMAMAASSCTLFRPGNNPIKNQKEVAREQDQALIRKYEDILGTRINKRKSLALYQSIDPWIGVPYRYGAMTKKGTDCSGFTATVYKETYNIILDRSTIDQYQKDVRRIGKHRLKQGDLVFFKIEKGKKVSHVGIYLGNHKFVHASVKRGVCINDLNEKYYTDHYLRGGRVKKLKLMLAKK